MIRQALERKDIRDVIQKRINEDEFEHGIEYSWMLEGNVLNFIYIYEESGNVVDFISTYSENGVTIIWPRFFNCTKMQSELADISNFWHDNCILESEYFDSKKWGYKPCNIQSSINEEMRYNFLRGFFTKSDALINVFRDSFEAKRFPELKSLDDLRFEVINNFQDLCHAIYSQGKLDVIDNPVWTNTCNVSSVAGFHYFDVMDVRYDVKYLIAFYQDIPVGLIKIGAQDECGFEGERRQVVCYIDVNEAYQRRGIAKLLIKQLAEVLEDVPLILTDESDMGKKCHMEKLFKEAGYSVPVYTQREYFEQYLYPKYRK